MKALIDGDIVARRVASTTNFEPTWIAESRCEEMIYGMLEETGADDYVIYLTDSTFNFRKSIYPDYKANRPAEEPIHNQYLKEFMIKKHKAIIAPEQEADDYLGINQDKIDYTTIICSIDKDLKQIPGNHYNFVKGEHSFVSNEEAAEFFYIQLLAGDKGDNIHGIPGLGPKRAKTYLDKWFEKIKIRTHPSYIEACFERYKKQYKTNEEAKKWMLLWGQVVKIRQYEDEIWTF